MTTMYFILLTWFALLKIHYEAHSAILIIKGSAYQDSLSYFDHKGLSVSGFRAHPKSFCSESSG